MKHIVWLGGLAFGLGAAAASSAQGPQTRLPVGTVVHRDLEYVKGGHERQRLDLYVPEKAQQPLPLIVWIHGMTDDTINREPPPISPGPTA